MIPEDLILVLSVYPVGRLFMTEQPRVNSEVVCLTIYITCMCLVAPHAMIVTFEISRFLAFLLYMAILPTLETIAQYGDFWGIF